MANLMSNYYNEIHNDPMTMSITTFDVDRCSTINILFVNVCIGLYDCGQTKKIFNKRNL